MEVKLAVPIFRIFDEAKAKEFYVGYLGFKVDWEHRFDDNMPLYMQIGRGGLTLHLSEHYGDGSPGAVLYVRMTGLDDFHAELGAKNYKYLRPGIENQPWKARCMTVIDPFANRIRFCEEI